MYSGNIRGFSIIKNVTVLHGIYVKSTTNSDKWRGVSQVTFYLFIYLYFCKNQHTAIICGRNTDQDR